VKYLFATIVTYGVPLRFKPYSIQDRYNKFIIMIAKNVNRVQRYKPYVVKMGRKKNRRI
jgi:hypothetical protein